MGEIATLGHPMVDLNYVASWLEGGWRKTTMPKGLPTEWEFVEEYHQRLGLSTISQTRWAFFALMNAFRMLAIMHGVYARKLGGISFGSGKSDDIRDQFLHTHKLAIRMLPRHASRL